MFSDRNTKFNASVLNEVDSNNDPISRWCKSGTRNTDAFCILCNCTISCAHHGAAAVKRHAGMKKHIDAAARHRDKDGNLLPPKLAQGTLDFSNGSANTSLEHQVSKAESTFALSVVAKGIPFSWGDTATSIYHCMFPDSDIAKKFSCGRIKLARIVSDGLGPCFKGQVVTELCQPNVYFSIMIDETPKPELRVQQLDVLLFSGFQLLFQKQEPLLHILHVELIVLVQRVLSRFLRHEAFADKSAEQLKRLDVMDASLWKSRPEVGTDTEKSMLEWDSSEKKRFYLGARAFYLACAKDLLQKLPLDNRVLQSASLLNWQSTNVESEVRALKYLVSQLPQVIKHEEVSSAIDEWHMLKCDSNSDLLALGGERIDVRWGKIFELKSPGGQPKYPLLSRLVKCLLCLPHGNADCERGFSENKRFYENRYSLCIASINGLRQTKTYLRRYDGDGIKVPLSTELLQSVRRSRARYTERTASAQQSESRKRLGDQDTGADVDEKRLRKNLEEKVTSSRALLKRAEDIISSGLRSKSLEQVEAGQTLLAEGNSALSQTLSQLEELSKKVSKRT
ncbi:hypothetical protein MRX96_006260 [Rhipicephalus microplus]